MTHCPYCDRRQEEDATCRGCGAPLPAPTVRVGDRDAYGRAVVCVAPGRIDYSPLGLDPTFERYHARLVL